MDVDLDMGMDLGMQRHAHHHANHSPRSGPSRDKEFEVSGLFQRAKKKERFATILG